MPWIVLVLAALFEVGWAIGLKLSDGFTRFWPAVWTVGALVASVALLALAARSLPIGTAYAIWAGIGTAGTALVGVLVYNEPATAFRMLCLVALIASIIGLRLATPA